jgi:hypothetical protein
MFVTIQLAIPFFILLASFPSSSQANPSVRFFPMDKIETSDTVCSVNLSPDAVQSNLSDDSIGAEDRNTESQIYCPWLINNGPVSAVGVFAKVVRVSHQHASSSHLLDHQTVTRR